MSGVQAFQQAIHYSVETSDSEISGERIEYIPHHQIRDRNASSAIVATFLPKSRH